MAEMELGVHSPSPRRRIRWVLLLGTVAIVVAAVTLRMYWGAPLADAKAPGAKGKAAAPAKAPAAAGNEAKAVAADRAFEEEATNIPQNVAEVNGEIISHEELAKQATKVFGNEVLQNLINKQILMQQCKAANVTISRSEVDQEIAATAQRFGLATDRWLSMLKAERGVSPSHYANDIIWPMLALRKLASSGEVTKDELKKAFQAKYGPAVRARMIACNEESKARKVQKQASAHPERFATFAKQLSDDPSTASLGGMVQPIRRFMGNEKIEEIAFSLEPGAISDVIQVGDQFVILKCEEKLPAQQISEKHMPEVTKALESEIREGKERMAANEVFRQLQEKSDIKLYYGPGALPNGPAGAAATVNGKPISIKELGDACISRHGGEVLDSMITRRILEQACKQAKVSISQKDVEEEIARAAEASGAMDDDGKPVSVDKWIETITERQGVSRETYINDAVWPSVALKKMVSKQVTVTDEDLRRGFEANYGPRVRCLAIVFNNQRRAQEIWQKARENNNEEYFGELAEQYSVEESSRVLRGEVPPIQRYGGQPILEKEAFALQPGELSGVIQVGDRFVVLRCLGFTEPIDVKPDEVQEHIAGDIFEKKLRLAMADELDALKEKSRWFNGLSGESHAPTQDGKAAKGANGPPRGSLKPVEGVEPALTSPPAERAPAARSSAPAARTGAPRTATRPQGK